MSHRGPDHQAVWGEGQISLGHCRLAIIDVDHASNQPMHLADRGLSIVFNGEIYNYKELRQELAANGAKFRTQGDTEVILHAFAHWGTSCFARFNGMFALAIWDQKAQQLVLARDRAGEKPLFLHQLPGGGIVFASELKALRRFGGISTTLNPVALNQFLAMTYVLGDQCILSGVEKLPPANFMTVSPGNAPRRVCYWDLAKYFRDKRSFSSEAAAAEELRALIDDSVKIRLASDVPLGAFLSGGLDSSAIVGSMVAAQPAGRTTTFSIGFNEKGFSELPEAQAVAAYFGVDHRARIVDADMAHVMPLLAGMADEPFADTSILASYHLARFSRQSVTVALSGDGGDELFAGYETYVADALHQKLSPFIPKALARSMAVWANRLVPTSFGKVSLDYKLKQFLAGLALPFERAHYSWREVCGYSERVALLRPDVAPSVLAHDPFDRFAELFAEVEGCHWLDRASYVDIKTFMVDDVLVKVDRSTMASSLEARAPFLDHRIMEFAAALPPEWKLKGGSKKHLLKLSQRGRLPQSVLSRRKRGFNVPMSHWLNGKLAALAQDASTCPAMQEWFDTRAIETLWRQHRSGERDNGYRLAALAMLGLWMEASR